MLEQSARKLGCLYPHERAEVSMAGSYSADLRERVLAAVEAGATPGAAARRFAVGRSTAYRWAREARVEGRRVAKRLGGGPEARVSRVGGGTGVRVQPWGGGRALRRCGWT